MLSHLTPTMHSQLSSSDSALAMCSTSSDETNKSLYPTEDESDGLFHSPRGPYSYPSQQHRSPMPFVYGPTPTYGFGLNLYEEMSSFAGKDALKELDDVREMFELDPSRIPYTFVHTTKRADPNIDVKLENHDLWKRFADLNLEMIITKNGR